MRKKNKLVYGWGINDVNYEVYGYELVNGKRKRVWICPYYAKWKKILERCFCLKRQAKQPTYRGCTVSEKWKYLSNFIKWVDSQPNKDWQNCEPDKDILLEGNKHYSPETVVFVSRKVNGFIKDCGKSRGKYMIGVDDSNKKSKPYRSRCCNPFTGEKDYLGIYETEIQAHKAWQDYKHKLSCQLAEEQSDPRVAKALREKYALYKDFTNV